MAIDKKSDYVGTHGGSYTDIDGQSKQFTYVDHDIKPGGATCTVSSDEIHKAKTELKEWRAKCIEKILSIPAALCPEAFTDFVIRGDKHPALVWNEQMIKDDGMLLDKLVTLRTLLENRAEYAGITL